MSSSSLGILITGAGSGIGRGLANHFAGKGHRLLLVDISQKSLTETRRQLHPNDNAVLATADVSKAADVAKLFQEIGEFHPDVLINNAGLQHVCPIDELHEDKWDLLVDVMLKAPFLLMQAVIPHMRKRGFGRVINIGSIHSLVASQFKSAYVAAKHGLLGLSKAAALETADTDITVNTICPAWVRTPLVEAQLSTLADRHRLSENQVVEKLALSQMPKKVFITVDEIAATVEFLTSHQARNITGQTIVIDGGWIAQ